MRRYCVKSNQLNLRIRNVWLTVTVDNRSFYEIVTSNGFVSSPYEFCAWMCLVGSNLKIEESAFNERKSAFIFESGFRHQGVANKMMARIFSSPSLREKYKYKSHTFIDKTEARPLQAADVLAWQWYKDDKRRNSGISEPRGDLRHLMSKVPHYARHADADRLRHMVNRLAEQVGNPLGSQIVGEAIRNPNSPIFKRRPIEQWAGHAFEAFANKVENASGDLE